jgi:hypothetical protein
MAQTVHGSSGGSGRRRTPWTPSAPKRRKKKKGIEKISEIVQKDRRLSILMILEMVNMDKETVRQILHDRLNLRKVCAVSFLEVSEFHQLPHRANTPQYANVVCLSL